MAQVNDLSRSLAVSDLISTLVVVVEMGKMSWLVRSVVPGVDRLPSPSPLYRGKRTWPRATWAFFVGILALFMDAKLDLGARSCPRRRSMRLSESAAIQKTSRARQTVDGCCRTPNQREPRRGLLDWTQGGRCRPQYDD